MRALPFYVAVGLIWAIAFSLMLLIVPAHDAGFYSGSVCLTAVGFSALVVASASLGAILGFVTAALFAVGGDR
jgi:hypothetical protein